MTPSQLNEPMEPALSSLLSDPQSFALTVTGILTVCGVAFFAGQSIVLPVWRA